MNNPPYDDDPSAWSDDAMHAQALSDFDFWWKQGRRDMHPHDFWLDFEDVEDIIAPTEDEWRMYLDWAEELWKADVLFAWNADIHRACEGDDFYERG